MKIKLTISITSIMLTILFILQFVNFPYFEWYNLVKYGMIAIISIFIVAKYKCYFKKKYMLVNFVAVLFCMLTIYASYTNRFQVKTRNTFLAAIVFSAILLVTIFFMEIIAEKSQCKKLVDVFFKCVLMIVISTDIIMILIPELVSKYGGNYLIGTKFDVVYMHLLLISIYLAKINFDFKSKFRKSGLILMGLWVIGISLYMKCATGIVGFILLYIFIYLVERYQKIFFNWIVFLVAQLLSLSFVFINGILLNNLIVQSVLVNILNRDVTLSSRTLIFEIVPQLLIGNTKWGFGYGTSYELGMKFGGFPDTQNSILEWIWQVGIPTTIIMLILFACFFYFSYKYLNKKNKKIVVPLLAFIYMLTVLGTVEITISSMFFAVMVMILSLSCERISK